MTSHPLGKTIRTQHFSHALLLLLLLLLLSFLNAYTSAASSLDASRVLSCHQPAPVRATARAETTAAAAAANTAAAAAAAKTAAAGATSRLPAAFTNSFGDVLRADASVAFCSLGNCSKTDVSLERTTSGAAAAATAAGSAAAFATGSQQQASPSTVAIAETASSSKDSSIIRKRHLVVVDWSDRVVPYDLAWLAQHALLQQQLLQLDVQQQQNKHSQKEGQQQEDEVEMLPGAALRRTPGLTACDFAILTQHSSVYTLGQGSKLSFVGADLHEKERQLSLPQQLQHLLQKPEGVRFVLQQIGDRIPPPDTTAHTSSSSSEAPPQLLRVERGGEVTWHGPGQLVFYPIFDLRRHRADVRMYIEALENTAAKTLIALWRDAQTASSLQHQQQQQQQLATTPLKQQYQQQEALSPPGLQLTRIRSMPGVWAGAKKICAVGVRLRRWVSFHGLALNIENSLRPYTRIVACGLKNKEVTNARMWLQQLQQQQRQKHLALEERQSTQLLARAARALIGAVASSFGFSSVAVTRDLPEALELQQLPADS